MLKILRVIFGVIASSLGMYALITSEFQVMPYALGFLGLMGIVIGISELKRDRRLSAIMSFLSAGFVIFVCFYTLNSFT